MNSNFLLKCTPDALRAAPRLLRKKLFQNRQKRDSASNMLTEIDGGLPQVPNIPNEMLNSIPAYFHADADLSTRPPQKPRTRIVPQAQAGHQSRVDGHQHVNHGKNVVRMATSATLPQTHDNTGTCQSGPPKYRLAKYCSASAPQLNGSQRVCLAGPERRSPVPRYPWRLRWHRHGTRKRSSDADLLNRRLVEGIQGPRRKDEAHKMRQDDVGGRLAPAETSPFQLPLPLEPPLNCCPRFPTLQPP